MYFDPLDFPLLDETLIPPPQQLVPPLDEPAPSTEQEDEAAHVADEGGYAEAAAGHAETVGGQEDLIGEQSGAREPDVKQALPDGPYDAYWDPSLPYYMPRNSRGVVDFSHHRRKCLVCRHAYRAVIEHDYLTWRDPAEIARDCGFRDARPILRHAEATGLDRHRARRVTSALERLIHKASSATPSAGSIVSAIKLYAQMTGAWTPPPRQVEVTHIRRVAQQGAPNNVRQDATHDVRADARPSASRDAAYGARGDERPSVPHAPGHAGPEDASNSAADARPSASEDIGGEVRRGAHESASRSVAQAVGDGVSHDVSEGVREEASDSLRHDVGEAAGDAARRSAREDASHSLRDELPKEIHEKDLTEASSDSLVAATVANHATSWLRIGGGPRPSRPRTLAGSFLSPPESPNNPRPPLAFSLLGPEIDGEPRPPLGPEVQISNQLPPRLESDVSP